MLAFGLSTTVILGIVHCHFYISRFKDGKIYLSSVKMALQLHQENMSVQLYPHEPHFYIAKLGSQGYTYFSFIFAQNMDCGYSLEPPRRGGSNVYPQSMF